MTQFSIIFHTKFYYFAHKYIFTKAIKFYIDKDVMDFDVKFDIF